MHNESADPKSLNDDRNDRLLALWETVIRRLAPLFLRNNITLPVLETMLRRYTLLEAVKLVKNSEVPDKESGINHAATLAGLTVEDTERATQGGDMASPSGSGKLTRMIHTLTTWQTHPAYRDTAGQPLDLTLRGEEPSFSALVGEDAEAMVEDLAKRLVRNGNVEWVGETGKLRYLHPVVSGGFQTPDDIQILTQALNDFLHSLQRTLDPNTPYRRRFRGAYYNNIDVNLADQAMEELHEEIHSFNLRCTKLLEKYCTRDDAAGIRIGAGSYSYREADLILDKRRKPVLDNSHK